MKSPLQTSCKGEVVYNYAYDIAYEMGRMPIRELLGHTVAEFSTQKRQTWLTEHDLLTWIAVQVICPAITVLTDSFVGWSPQGRIGESQFTIMPLVHRLF
ncbi:MAG: hypothetical protein JWM99_70 [Verrucomicrobiales bacterium]|nr:hypothetical protein [Verrucomicrobiales bacterium]